MGEAIADLLKGDLKRTSDEFAGAFQKALVAKEQGHVNPEVTKIEQAASEIAEQMDQMPESDNICTRDYSKACPEGWSALGGSTCQAPKTYGGSCAALESFEGYSPLEKSLYAKRCVAPWPCFGECAEGRDYDELCPVEWTSVGGGVCQAPSSYGGSCLKQYRFDTYSLEKKEQVAHACGFQWPCKAPCSRDYSSSCPEGWSEYSPGMCQAPPTYVGECPFGANMKDATEEQKAAFETKCSVKWPCKVSAALLHREYKKLSEKHSEAAGNLRSRTMAVVSNPSMPVVNLHVAEAPSGAAEEVKAAEGGRTRRHKLAELEEAALRNREMFSNILGSLNHQIEKVVDLMAGMVRAWTFLSG